MPVMLYNDGLYSSDPPTPRQEESSAQTQWYKAEEFLLPTHPALPCPGQAQSTYTLTEAVLLQDLKHGGPPNCDRHRQDVIYSWFKTFTGDY